LLKCPYEHCENESFQEIVIGSNMDKIYLVMDYVEHDMKTLMDSMFARGKRFRTGFVIESVCMVNVSGEIKTLLRQLLSGVAHMHDQWILHRDLKSSNLLLSHKGILKIGDFGLSREFGDPLKPYTPIVVTLWYRSPELLLGLKVSFWKIHMCCFPLFPAIDCKFQIGDFGLSREFGDPLKPYTPIVVTLWYRSPELLLGLKVKSFWKIHICCFPLFPISPIDCSSIHTFFSHLQEYSTFVDMWSCGCIFAEFFKLKSIFPGKGEIDQINKIFMGLGTPNENIWPGYSSLPVVRKMKFEHYEPGELEKKFPPSLIDESGLQFIKQMLTYDPNKRITARNALHHEWFDRYPPPVPPELFPTWPAKSEMGRPVVKGPVVKPPSVNDKLVFALPLDDTHELAVGYNLAYGSLCSMFTVQNAKLYKELKIEPKKESFALKFDVQNAKLYKELKIEPKKESFALKFDVLAAKFK
uniref:Protein kinase domain-containing protein n=1 Tax=Gongylonema pulchrum TaxID=637853 RepID=A0A183E633_9BILA